MNWMKFVEYLPYMGKGMLAIIIVIGIIILFTAWLNKIMNKFTKKK